MQLSPDILLDITILSGDLAGSYVAYVLGAHRLGLRVTVPMVLNEYRPLPAGTEIECSFTLDNVRWHFQSQVLGYEGGSHPDMIISSPSHLAPRERRELFRVNVGLPTLFWVEEPFWGEPTRTVNISLGGACVRTSRILPRGLPVLLQIYMGDSADSLMTFHGQVVWSRYVGTTPQTGVRFNPLSASDESLLSRYLIECELRLRESGLGTTVVNTREPDCSARSSH